MGGIEFAVCVCVVMFACSGRISSEISERTWLKYSLRDGGGLSRTLSFAF